MGENIQTNQEPRPDQPRTRRQNSTCNWSVQSRDKWDDSVVTKAAKLIPKSYKNRVTKEHLAKRPFEIEINEVSTFKYSCRKMIRQNLIETSGM